MYVYGKNILFAVLLCKLLLTIYSPMPSFLYVIHFMYMQFTEWLVVVTYVCTYISVVSYSCVFMYVPTYM